MGLGPGGGYEPSYEKKDKKYISYESLRRLVDSFLLLSIPLLIKGCEWSLEEPEEIKRQRESIVEMLQDMQITKEEKIRISDILKERGIEVEYYQIENVFFTEKENGERVVIVMFNDGTSRVIVL